MSHPAPTQPPLDALVVGAGFAGLALVQRLRGMGLNVQVLEAGGDVGGTWFWNRYPGCRCDVESLEYSYAFSAELQQDWTWTERYATQPEILAYARHVAERFDLRRDIRFHTRVNALRWDEPSATWTAHTTAGDTLHARVVLMATGVLSASRTPEFEGLQQFQGGQWHTARWPERGVDLAGQRVAVVGVGSSGVQAIPLIAQQAAQLHVLMRTPNYVVPARNALLSAETVREAKACYPQRRQQALRYRGGVLLDVGPQSALQATPQELERGFEARWQRGGAFAFQSAFNDIQTHVQANRLASDFLRRKIGQIVHDPATAAALQPQHLLGTRRLCVGSDYFETYNRPHVELVDLRQLPLQCFTAQGVRVGQGAAAREIALDAVVFATGFDAMTGALTAVHIEGEQGRTLQQHWAAGPRSHLGLMVAGFPNLFTVTGPGSPAVLSNVIVSIEHHVGWIADALAHLRQRGQRVMRTSAEAEAAWVDHVAELGRASLISGGESWYLGANVPGKPRVLMPYVGGVPAYQQRCAEVAARGYAGFEFA